MKQMNKSWERDLRIPWDGGKAEGDREGEPQSIIWYVGLLRSEG